MAKRMFMAVFGVFLLAAGGWAACGGGSAATSPNDVQAALRATANESGLKLTTRITGSPDKQQNGSSDDMSPAQEQAIIDSTLVLTVHTANNSALAGARSGGELDLAIEHGGDTLAELRVVATTLYAQVDIPKFSSTYHLNQGQVSQFQSQLTQLGSQVGGLNALNEGKWVSVDINEVNQFAQTAGFTLPSSPQLVGRIVGALFNSLARMHVDSAHGNQAEMTVNARAVVTALAQAVSDTPGMSSFGGQINNLAERAGNSVPANATGKLNMTLGNGKVTHLELPIRQLQKNPPPAGQGPNSITMDVASAGAVSAPSGATALNLAQLFHAMAGSSS